MPGKLRGTKRVRFNAQLDHTDSLRIKRQARLRGMTQADLLRAAIDLLEIDWANHEKIRSFDEQLAKAQQHGESNAS